MSRPANDRRFPNRRANRAAGKPAQSLVFLGCRARPKPAACIPCQDVKTKGLDPSFDLRAPGTPVHTYQSPPMVNAGLPGRKLAARKIDSTGGWTGNESLGRLIGMAPRLSDPPAPRTGSTSHPGSWSRDEPGGTEALAVPCATSLRASGGTALLFLPANRLRVSDRPLINR